MKSDAEKRTDHIFRITFHPLIYTFDQGCSAAMFWPKL